MANSLGDQPNGKMAWQWNLHGLPTPILWKWWSCDQSVKGQVEVSNPTVTNYLRASYMAQSKGNFIPKPLWHNCDIARCKIILKLLDFCYLDKKVKGLSLVLWFGKTPFGLLLPFRLTLPAWGQYFGLLLNFRLQVLQNFWIFVYLRTFVWLLI